MGGGLGRRELTVTPRNLVQTTRQRMVPLIKMKKP